LVPGERLGEAVRVKSGEPIPSQKKHVDLLAQSRFPKELGTYNRAYRKWVPGFTEAVMSWFDPNLGYLCYHTASSKGSNPGYPDIHCIHEPSGKEVWSELKIETGKVSQDQRRWLYALAKKHFHVYVWWPSDENEIMSVIQGIHDKWMK
jgi:hypothetical protein